MWFFLSLLAMSMLVARRTAEKSLSSKVDSLAMMWLQQLFALPFIILSLGLAKFYWPSELGTLFWTWTVVYAAFGALDLFLYFKALSLADVSYVAPLLSLVGVATVIGSVIILHQQPTALGWFGACLVVAGGVLVHRGKEHHPDTHAQNRLALWLILALIVIRAFYANVEVWPLRESNATTFNFYTSALAVPIMLLVWYLVRRKTIGVHVQQVRTDIRTYIWPLLFIGLTYTINLTSTYQAKLLSPTAGYVTSIKAASVVPMVLIGAWLFREKVTRQQWYGVALISLGLLGLGLG